MKYMTAILIALLTVGTWFHIAGEIQNGGKGYQQNMQEAAAYEERGLYTKAIDSYLAAFDDASQKQQQAIYVKVVTCYEQLGDMESFEQYCRQAISSFPKQQTCYQKLISYYQEKEKFDTLVPLLEDAMAQFPKEDWYQKIYLELEKSWQVTNLGYDDMTDWLNGYVAGRTMGQNEDDETVTEYQIMSGDGSLETEGLYYQELSMTDDSITSFLVKDEKGRWKTVNDKGYEMENNLPASFAAIGVMHEGYAWAQTEDGYHLINTAMNLGEQCYDGMSSINEGHCAVKKGSSWALFSIKDGKETTKYQFTDIKMDEFQRCYVNGCFFGQQGSGYCMYNAKGKKIGKETFADAKPFVGSQPAAVKIGDQWGFVKKDGTIFLKAQYEDARSFSNGYAAVKQNGKWGFINRDNEMVVEPQFEDAKSIGDGGGVPVQEETGFWDMLWMYTVKYRAAE